MVKPQLKTLHNNKMTSCFAVINYEKKISINKAAFMKNKKQSSKNDYKYGWEM